MILLSAAAAAALTGSQMASAWFSDADAAVNLLTLGGVNTSITESFEDPGVPEPGEVIERLWR